MTEVILFDDGKGLLAPLTDLRAAFDIRTGAFTTAERLCAALNLVPVAYMTPPHLAEVTRERHAAPLPGSDKPVPVNTLPRSSEPRLFLNGRCPLPYDFIARLEPGQAVVEQETGDLIAAILEPAEFRELQNGGKLAAAVSEEPRPSLISRPWHVIRFRDRCLEIDLEMLATSTTVDLPPGVLGIGEEPLTIAPTATIYPGVTLDMEQGPIVIADHATVRPGATIIGPAYIGEHTTILDKALVKGHTAIGPWCKVAGEVGGVIFQGFANKGHDGHLGDSYVGEWVNFGAGTTNSNLLNTYGEVIASAPGGTNERTGLQFLGAIVGDHVKTAISTRIMTGAIIQTGGMFAQTAAVPGTTPTAMFAWSTDGGVRTFRFEKFLETAKAMMARRKITPTEAYITALRALGEPATSLTPARASDE